MSKKLLSVLLALMLVLGCTVMAGAETVTVNEYADDPVLSQMDADLLDEVKEAVIATLPEDMQDKEYTLTSNGDETGESISLVSTEVATPAEVQSLIDDGTIKAADLDVPDDVTVCLMSSDIITPQFMDAEGNTVNLLSAYDSTYWSSSWQAWDDGPITVYGKAYNYVYSNVTYQALRPVAVRGMYDDTGNHTVNYITVSTVTQGDLVAFPQCFESSSFTTYTTGYSYTIEIYQSNPEKQVQYEQSVSFPSNRCIIIWDISGTRDGYQMMSLYAKGVGFTYLKGVLSIFS